MMSHFRLSRWVLLRLVIWLILGGITVFGAFLARDRIQRFVRFVERESRNDRAIVVGPHTRGLLFLVGGGELPPYVAEKFIELAGGSSARVVMIPGCEADEEYCQQFTKEFLEFDVDSLDVLHVDSREEANDPALSTVLETATAVWLGGGQQTRFATTYSGTIIELRMRELLDRGGIIGGTSAGASAVTSIMIAGGRREPIAGNGLGFFPDAIVDQHFLKRNRPSRLLKLLNEHPDLVGFGIDESTALIVELPSRRLSVIGESYVMVVIPSRTQKEPPRIEILRSGDRTSLDQLQADDSPGVPEWLAEEILYPQ